MQRVMIFLLISSWVLLSTALSRGTRTEAELESILLIDTRIPVFVDGRWRIMSDEQIQNELRRRDDEDSGRKSAARHDRRRDIDEEELELGIVKPRATTTEVVIDTSTVTKAGDLSTTTTAAASPLPSPFDGALAANFSNDDTCPNFINAFLSDATFKSCYPVSLLLQGSRSFFEAEKSFFSITQVLDAACAANVETCTEYFNALASRLIEDSTCGEEYKLGNALVVDAYRGMKTYETVYRATCLMTSSANPSDNDTDSDSAPDSNNGTDTSDNTTKSYCFANAITNRSTPSNAYLYYLPFNHTLPPTSAPACGSCTRQTMEIYQAATSNRKADISYSYPSAAHQINSECGPDFVNTTLAAVVDNAAPTSIRSQPMSSSTLLLLTFAFAAISRWML